MHRQLGGEEIRRIPPSRLAAMRGWSSSDTGWFRSFAMPAASLAQHVQPFRPGRMRSNSMRGAGRCAGAAGRAQPAAATATSRDQSPSGSRAGHSSRHGVARRCRRAGLALVSCCTKLNSQPRAGSAGRSPAAARRPCRHVPASAARAGVGRHRPFAPGTMHAADDLHRVAVRFTGHHQLVAALRIAVPSALGAGAGATRPRRLPAGARRRRAALLHGR